MTTSLTSSTLGILEEKLEESIIELQEDIKKTVRSYGLTSTRTIGKSKKLDKYIFELQLIKQLKKNL
ncbi:MULTISPECIES: Spo0E family sporulation regulatory protein-aspartic acid phosphatase [Bacillaceae]|uniref:Spo0E family sporulation regulatory protein-aspartic acid phosphatase n=1 Tax=Bacillaceae TaxID=186817 RepID=UPI000BFDC596|nr:MULTISPECIES: Spo0E family sporulation regulatory protein-aspartic acid phosphatase [Bacillaceae]MCM3162630.1 Spo0E family sporulation regulatory protein-aspartic acid phosphatase [Metabacillus litoralis]MCM3410073.1 Spo0E family sporulation regulatory protein-aspartic acid phosphatase [Metabacillus litoralis]PGT80172.1 hypothetical protein COD11_21770 [Bacillus sp. AFS040349]